MTTTTVHDTAATRTGRSPLPALAGIGALAAFAGAVVTFGDPMRGARTPAEAAERARPTRRPTLAAAAPRRSTPLLAHRRRRPAGRPARARRRQRRRSG